MVESVAWCIISRRALYLTQNILFFLLVGQTDKSLERILGLFVPLVHMVSTKGIGSNNM